ncbi:MAG: universal stress protein [Dehalococcoidia bacterium]
MVYKRVLVTLDGSQASEAILPEVEKLGQSTGVEVLLLMVVPPPERTTEGPSPLVVSGVPAPGGTVSMPAPRAYESRGQAIERAKEEVRHYLDDKAATLTETGLNVKTHVAVGKPVDEIVAHVREYGADLIMMATHGHSGLSQVIFGGVAGRVLGSGARPVLLVRPDRSES